MQTTEHKVSGNFKKDTGYFREIYKDCADIKMTEFVAGKEKDVRVFFAHIEVAVDVTALTSSSIGRMLGILKDIDKQRLEEELAKNVMGVAGIAYPQSIEEAAQGILIGDTIFLIEGCPYAIKVTDRGYPRMGIEAPDSEKVIRGVNEGFTDSIKTNTSMIRKKIKSTRLRVKEQFAGLRSHTNVDLVYMKDLVEEGMVEEIEKRLKEYEMDAVLDTGILEQLAEEKWYSPFPQFQTTQRPDRAAQAILDGKVVILSDNSNTALMVPTDWNSFLKTSDDYFTRAQTASFARLIRYLAAFFAMTLPGLYVAMTNFHTQLLPTSLLLSFWQARLGVPFPAMFEVVLMELSFELLREAGVRLPGAMGNTIGIVGGLIIGQAAVDANIVSPIVVIVVAFTALCSFAIPNEEFAFAFRIIKFWFIFWSAKFGFFGFLAGGSMVLVHLTKLYSFGIPYLMPFAGKKGEGREDEKDSFLRFPLRFLKQRPIYAAKDEKVKLKRKE